MELFAKAPIQEALLDIQVQLPPEAAALDLKAYGQGLEERFPNRDERVQVVQRVQLLGEQQQIPPTKSIEGYLFISREAGKIVQARRDGFTFNKLRPYSKWDDFSAEARELWLRYVEFAHPVLVRRLGLRYINRIEIPDNLRDLGEICLLFPSVPDGVPGAWFEFFQRFASLREDGYLSIVTLAIDAPAAPARAAIILDIDIVRPLPAGTPDTDELWRHFDKMRTLKNEIFDASLPPRAKALFR